MKEAKRLEALKINGEKNGLEGLKMLSSKEFKKIEPNTEGVAALWVPHSGIINYKSVCNKLADLITKTNPKSKIAFNC